MIERLGIYVRTVSAGGWTGYSRTRGPIKAGITNPVTSAFIILNKKNKNKTKINLDNQQ